MSAKNLPNLRRFISLDADLPTFLNAVYSAQNERVSVNIQVYS